MIVGHAGTVVVLKKSAAAIWIPDKQTYSVTATETASVLLVMVPVVSVSVWVNVSVAVSVSVTSVGMVSVTVFTTVEVTVEVEIWSNDEHSSGAYGTACKTLTTSVIKSHWACSVAEVAVAKDKRSEAVNERILNEWNGL